MIKIKKIITNENQWIFIDNKFSQFMIFNPETDLQNNDIFTKLLVLLKLLFSLIMVLIYFTYQKFIFKLHLKYKINKIIFNAEVAHSVDKIIEHNKIDDSYFFININKKKEILKICNISFLLLIKNINKCFFQIINVHYKYKFPKKINKILNTKLSQRVSNFIIISSIFNSLSEKKIKCEIYSGGLFFFSYAAINNNLKTYYYTHGLMGKFYYKLLPKFDCTYVFSNEEKKILKKNNPDINILTYNYKKIYKYEKSIIIFTRGHDQTIDDKSGYETYRDLIKFFLKNNYKIYIKLHPLYEGSYFKKKSKEYIILNKDYSNTYELLNDISPQFVVSWFSSVLAESLYSNIIPINLLTQKKIDADKSNKFSKNVDTLDWILYPIEKKSINWAKSKNIIRELLNNKNKYNKMINELFDET